MFPKFYIFLQKKKKKKNTFEARTILYKHYQMDSYSFLKSIVKFIYIYIKPIWMGSSTIKVLLLKTQSFA